MLLALDVGNTQTVVGLFASVAAREPNPPDHGGGESETASARGVSGPGVPGELADLLHHWRIATVAERTADEYALLITELLRLVGLEFAGTRAGDGVDGIVVSSSAPDVTSAIREMARIWFDVPLVVIEPGIRTGMPILYDNPKDVGADRIANAVGAIDLFGGPAIVVDMGTATTFDAISAAGEYLGGAIAPGIEISTDALFEHAAALRRVELVEPRNVIGKSTVESIQSGVVYGYTGLVDGMCRRISEQLGPAAIIATGGLAGLITPLSDMIQYHEPWLTLHGLRLVFDRNVARDESGREI
ncbi:MAG: type III pantothenate kinase [Acidimicrobiales bacterium]|jgi:type III pantothenate kinase